MEIASLIDYSGDNHVVVWKHPITNFNNKTKLIVRESQRALFFLNGKLIDEYMPGDSLIDTGKFPVVNSILSAFSKNYVYNSEIYFVNLVEQTSVQWGLNPKVKYIDRTADDYQFDIGLSGSYDFKIIDPKKIVINYVGSESFLGREKLISLISPMVSQKIRTCVSKTLSSLDVSVFKLGNYIEQISFDVMNELNDFTDEYGIEITKFWINNIVFPEEDVVYQQIKELTGKVLATLKERELYETVENRKLEFDKKHDIERANLEATKNLIQAETEGRAIEILANATAKKRKIEGYDFVIEKTYDVASKMVENQNVSSPATSGIGIGMIGGMAAGVGNAIANTVSSAVNHLDGNRHDNNLDDSDIVFETQYNSFAHRVKKLKVMRDEGVISDQDFEERKSKLLKEI